MRQRQSLRGLICCLAVLASLTAWADHRPLLPRPQQAAYGSGSLPLKGLAIRFAMKPNTQDRFTASKLADGLGEILGGSVSVRERGGRGIILNRTGNGAEVPT